ncbi:MAG: hypothetical protein R2867_23625 [Caldilineaceae bacterium]
MPWRTEHWRLITEDRSPETLQRVERRQWDRKGEACVVAVGGERVADGGPVGQAEAGRAGGGARLSAAAAAARLARRAGRGGRAGNGRAGARRAGAEDPPLSPSTTARGAVPGAPPATAWGARRRTPVPRSAPLSPAATSHGAPVGKRCTAHPVSSAAHTV